MAQSALKILMKVGCGKQSNGEGMPHCFFRNISFLPEKRSSTGRKAAVLRRLLVLCKNLLNKRSEPSKHEFRIL